MVPLCLDQGVGVLPYSPLARGLLTGTRTRARNQDDDPVGDALSGRRHRSYRVVLKDASGTRWVRVEVVQGLSERERSVTVRLR